MLGSESLQAAAKALVQCVKNDEKAFVVIDSDCDGFTFLFMVSISSETF